MQMFVALIKLLKCATRRFKMYEVRFEETDVYNRLQIHDLRYNVLYECVTGTKENYYLIDYIHFLVSLIFKNIQISENFAKIIFQFLDYY